MFEVNPNFLNLTPSYLFSEIAKKVAAFKEKNPGAEIISMGIGDVTRPICRAAVEAMHRAVDDLAQAERFKGYGPEQGYAFLREAIAKIDYHDRGIDIAPDEIFVSDGAKSDTGNIGDLFAPGTRIAVTDPVYPVYVDTNVMAGRAGKMDSDGRYRGITYLSCTADNDFVPQLPTQRVDVVYLCYPNNPTGTTLTRQQLADWVDYARTHGVLILFDSAYEAYIRHDDTVPHSIYEIEGAKECAIEFRSFSKTAGFTGLRCGYTVVPHHLRFPSPGSDGRDVELNRLWNRRQCTKFNGASYVSQRAAEALYTHDGREQVRSAIDYYMANASMLRQVLAAEGYEFAGGEDSPYLWVKTPDGMGSWEFFDHLLSRKHLVVTPGCGFGPSGEGYVRLTAFNSREATAEAGQRLAANLQ